MTLTIHKCAVCCFIRHIIEGLPSGGQEIMEDTNGSSQHFLHLQLSSLICQFGAFFQDLEQVEMTF